jgi:hypothetical protein
MLFAAADTWTQKANLVGTARFAAIGFSIGSKGYIGTGFDGSYSKDFWEYDPVVNTWTQKADFGGGVRSDAVGFSIGTKGYVGTGYDSSSYGKDFWEYDPAVNTWTQKADFAGTARHRAVGFSIGSKGYIGTGYDVLDSYKKDFWEFDPAVNTWVQKADFGGTARYGSVGFSIESKGYIGTGNTGSYSKDFWKYDPAANTWVQKADFGGTDRSQAIGFSVGNKGYIGGGQDFLGSYKKDFLEYEPSTYTYTLYFPHIATGLPWQTEIAVINTSGQTITGTLKGYSDAGQLVETKAVTLSARGRRQIIVADEFTNHTNIGYIVFETDSAAVQGYTKFYQEGTYRAAIPAVKEVNASDIYISHIATDAQWWTGVSLVNTTSATKEVTITFNNGQSVPYIFNANQHRAFMMPDAQSAVITNASGIIGLELFGSVSGGNQLDGLLLTGNTYSTLYYPHVASDNVWWTGIVAYNPSTLAGTITITPYSAQGVPLTPSTLPIGGKEKYIGVVSNLGLPAGTAWFRIDATRPLSGFELFATHDGAQLAAYAGGGGTGARAGVFAKIEKSGWTGIAFVNTEATAATVTLTAYNDSGEALATQALPVGAYAKEVHFAEDIFPQNISAATYIAYSSDRNVVGFQINGSADGMMLDGLPGLAGTDILSSTPSKPTGFVVTPVSSSQINLSWDASNGATGYNIYKNGTILKTVTATSTSDGGLSPSTNYCYYITGYNSAGESEATSHLCATTHATTSTGCSSYFPTTIGSTWTARLAGNPPRTVNITVQQDGKFKQIETYMSGPFTITTTCLSQYTCDNTGVYYVKGECVSSWIDNGRQVTASSTTIYSNCLVQPNNLSTGAVTNKNYSWTSTGVLATGATSKGSGSGSIKVTVMGTESVTVPAGTFNAVKLLTEHGNIDILGGIHTTKSYSWMASGVGGIKSASYPNNVVSMELISYSVH